MDVNISPGSGQFEISENGSVVATGRITILSEPDLSDVDCSTPILDAEPFPLNSDDIYREWRLRGYDYGPTFRNMLSADATGTFCRSTKSN